MGGRGDGCLVAVAGGGPSDDDLGAVIGAEKDARVDLDADVALGAFAFALPSAPPLVSLDAEIAIVGSSNDSTKAAHVSDEKALDASCCCAVDANPLSGLSSIVVS